MSAILETLLREHGDELIGQLTNALGLKQNDAENLVKQGVPVVMAGLRQQKNQTPDGAQEIAGIANALGGGDLLNQLGSIFGSAEGQPHPPEPEPMKNLMGNTQNKMIEAITKRTGLSPELIQKALMFLVPIVISAVVKFGSQAKTANPELPGSGANESGAAADPLGGLGAILDSDGDGSILDDILEMAAGAGAGQQQPAAAGSTSASGGLLGGILRAVLGGHKK